MSWRREVLALMDLSTEMPHNGNRKTEIIFTEITRHCTKDLNNYRDRIWSPSLWEDTDIVSSLQHRNEIYGPKEQCWRSKLSGYLQSVRASSLARLWSYVSSLVWYKAIKFNLPKELRRVQSSATLHRETATGWSEEMRRNSGGHSKTRINTRKR